ncbi:MAG: FGGY family carbohydrate kinase [Candidatus Binatia bacterium]
MRQRLRQAAGASIDRVAAVTLTTQRGTYVNVDRDGAALRPAIVWLDQRKASSAGIIPAATVPLLKLLGLHDLLRFAAEYCRSNWIRQQQPEIWARTHKFLCLSGYLTHRLTGAFRDSAGNIIGTMPFDVKRFAWAARWDPKRRLFPIEDEKLPELVMPGEPLGHVTAEAAAATGLAAGLPVIAGSNDKACEILGAGCLEPDTACVSFGTIATVNTQNRRYVELQRRADAAVSVRHTGPVLLRGRRPPRPVDGVVVQAGVRPAGAPAGRRRHGAENSSTGSSAPSRRARWAWCCSRTGRRGRSTRPTPRGRSSASATSTPAPTSTAPSSRDSPTRSRRARSARRRRTASP